MNFTNRVKNARIWQTIEVFSESVVRLAYFAIMARLLLKADYGLMVLAIGAIGIGNILTTSLLLMVKSYG